MVLLHLCVDLRRRQILVPEQVRDVRETDARHPQMRFDVELSDRAVDLVDEGFDAALRIGKIGSQQLVGRKVGVTRLICCASPAYLEKYGEPKSLPDLNEHHAVNYVSARSGNCSPSNSTRILRVAYLASSVMCFRYQ